VQSSDSYDRIEESPATTVSHGANRTEADRTSPIVIHGQLVGSHHPTPAKPPALCRIRLKRINNGHCPAPRYARSTGRIVKMSISPMISRRFTCSLQLSPRVSQSACTVRLGYSAPSAATSRYRFESRFCESDANETSCALPKHAGNRPSANLSSCQSVVVHRLCRLPSES
jgi:hypothetical protein